MSDEQMTPREMALLILGVVPIGTSETWEEELDPKAKIAPTIDITYGSGSYIRNSDGRSVSSMLTDDPNKLI